MVLDRIATILHSCTTGTPLCPSNVLYNEQWLLRMVLDWFATHPVANHPLAIPPDACWFSGARLQTAFRKRHPGDQLAEKRPRVDGIIGQFEIGTGRKNANVALNHNARHVIVLMARFFDPMSSGIKPARYFDEPARTVAAIAETLRKANCYPLDIEQLGFYILAPETQIARNIFADHVNRESLRQKTQQRVKAYGKAKKQWYSEWFRPTLDHITIDTLSWEAILATIQTHDQHTGELFAHFYRQCLEFN